MVEINTTKGNVLLSIFYDMKEFSKDKHTNVTVIVFDDDAVLSGRSLEGKLGFHCFLCKGQFGVINKVKLGHMVSKNCCYMISAVCWMNRWLIGPLAFVM